MTPNTGHLSVVIDIQQNDSNTSCMREHLYIIGSYNQQNVISKLMRDILIFTKYPSGIYKIMQ